MCRSPTSVFFFFNDTATTEIYTLSLHDALPIFQEGRSRQEDMGVVGGFVEEEVVHDDAFHRRQRRRSEEHTSELQSQSNLVCRLLLEKKKPFPVYQVGLSDPPLLDALPTRWFVR